MYLNYYNLNFKPFDVSPDHRFLWLGEKHKKALLSLKNGILNGNNQMALIGEPGTGKTTIVNALLHILKKKIVYARISDPSLGEQDFFNMIGSLFGIKERFKNQNEFKMHFELFLNIASEKNIKVIIVIEEFQRLKKNIINQIDMLSKIGNFIKPIVEVIFVGQKDANRTLLDNDAIRKKFSLIFTLDALEEFEVSYYIRHRLKVAGTNNNIFSSNAFQEIYKFSQGIPRMINNICDFSLLTGYKRNINYIKSDLIKECVKSYNFSYKNSSTKSDNSHKSLKFIKSIFTTHKFRYIGSSLLVLMCFIFSFIYYSYNAKESSSNNNNVFANTLRILIGRTSDTFLPVFNEIGIQGHNKTNTMINTNDSDGQIYTQLDKPDQLDTIGKEMDTLLFELKQANARIDELQSASAEHQRLMDNSNQLIKNLKDELQNEKKKNEILQVELSQRDFSITDLEERIYKLRNITIRYETEIDQNKIAVKKLKDQLVNLKLKTNEYESSPNVLNKKEISNKNNETIETEYEPPNPNDIIDWIIKKRSE